jgi:hypothetical protein
MKLLKNNILQISIGIVELINLILHLCGVFKVSLASYSMTVFVVIIEVIHIIILRFYIDNI